MAYYEFHLLRVIIKNRGATKLHPKRAIIVFKEL